MNQSTVIRRSPKNRPVFAGFRRYARQDLRTDVVIQDQEGWEVPLECVNLSPTGMFIESQYLFEIGDRHVLIFKSPETEEWLRIEAKVVRIDTGEADVRVEPAELAAPGMAYEFEATDDRTWSELCALLAR